MDCRTTIINPGDYYLRLFGGEDVYEKPWELIICMDCGKESKDENVQKCIKEHSS